jgi:hypothetical protein
MKHPFQIEMPRNERMDCYEIVLSIGDIESLTQAEKIAKALREFLEATIQ